VSRDFFFKNLLKPTANPKMETVTALVHDNVSCGLSCFAGTRHTTDQGCMIAGQSP